MAATIQLYSGRHSQFYPSFEVRSLGVVFDSDLSLKAHVSQLTARCYSCLRRIKSCRRALTRMFAATVVNSLTVTRLDYCNSLLAGCTRLLTSCNGY